MRTEASWTAAVAMWVIACATPSANAGGWYGPGFAFYVGVPGWGAPYVGYPFDLRIAEQSGRDFVEPRLRHAQLVAIECEEFFG